MKKLFVFVVAFLAALVLAGCKPGATEGNKGSIAEENYTIETVENLKAQADKSVLVSFRIPFGTTIQAQIQEFIDEFEAEYPSVDIELDVVSGYDDMKDATIQDIQGGIVPTMTVGYPDHFAEYLISKSIISLDKFIEDPAVGYSQDELDDFLPGYISENRQFDKKGSYVGLPFNKSTEAMYYNADFFDEFDLSVPTTWDEYEDLCEDIYEIVAGLEDNQYAWLGKIKTNLANKEFLPCMYDSGGNLFTTIIHQFGGQYTGSIYKSNGNVDVQKGQLLFQTSPEAADGLAYLQELATKNYLNMPEAWELQYGSGALCAGQTIMNIGSTGGSSYYNDAISNIEVAPIPYKDSEHKYVIQQGTNVCIMSQASDLQKLAAWLFIKHMLTPERTAQFAITTGYMPVRQSAYETEEYLEFLESEFLMSAKVHKATAQYAKDGWNYFVDAAWAGSSNVRTECQTAIAQILVDKVAVAKALEDAVGRIG